MSVLFEGLFIERVPTLINLIHMLFQSVHDAEWKPFRQDPDAVKDAYVYRIFDVRENSVKD